MRSASLILALLSALLLAVLVRAQFAPDPSAAAAEPLAAPASGMALLKAHPCRVGETRKVTVRGVEDGYSPTGREPAVLHPRVTGPHRRTTVGDPRFDATVGNQGLAAWFELAPATASAMLVLRFRPIGDNLNDTLTIGDQTVPGHRVTLRPADLEKRPGWRRHGDLYWSELADIRLKTGQSVLDTVGGADGGRIFDVLIADDTAVDFIGLAACEAPPWGKGLTLDTFDIPESLVPDAVAFECRPIDPAQPACKPFVGDRSCEDPLPLLCFRDLDMPAPAEGRAVSELMSRRWSGGEVAATAPVRGSSFATIGDADRACSRQFGKGWRVAEWHVGGNGFGFSAKRNGRAFSGRYWVDIRGVPYGTCWRREDGR